jgi:hypothetical protein
VAVQGSGWTDFDVGRYDVHEIADAQDYSGIVNHMRSLDDRIAAWMRDHPGAEVIAHFTGGTKAMTVLPQQRHWNRRTKIRKTPRPALLMLRE